MHEAQRFAAYFGYDAGAPSLVLAASPSTQDQTASIRGTCRMTRCATSHMPGASGMLPAIGTTSSSGCILVKASVDIDAPTPAMSASNTSLDVLTTTMGGTDTETVKPCRFR